MRRSRLGWAGLISVLLHVALLAWLWGREPVRPVSTPPPASAPLVVEIVSTPSQPPAPIPTSAPPAPPARPQRPRPPPPPAPAPKPPAADQHAPAPAAPETATAPAEPTARPDAPLAQASKPPVLVPPSASGGWSLPATALPPMQSGHTLHPDDPSLSAEVLKAEEHARVTERVQGFAEDDLATLRVENGLVHPYFSGIRTALARQMEKAPLFGTTLGLSERLAQSYLKQARNYGAGGTPPPARPARGANDRAAPTASERLESISHGNPAHDSMRAFLQAGEAVQELAEPPPELLIVLELQQAADGQLRSVTVVETSGNKAFDTFVLDAVPASLAKLSPPPAEALGRHNEGLRTLWAVEGRVVYLRHLKELEGQDAWYIASAAGLGLLAGKFEETTGDIYVIDLRNPKFVCRPRLLKVW